MKLLCFEGKFACNAHKQYEGLIALCHMDVQDTMTTCLRASKELLCKTAREIVLVPFVHLHHTRMHPTFAKQLLESLNELCAEHRPTVLIPFGVEKSFFLEAPSRNNAIYFLHF